MFGRVIYICVATRNEAATIGLLLWKVRQVFVAFPREYHLLVADDGSTDATGEVLEPYQRVLPLSLTRHDRPQGYAACVEALFREAVARTDRPKRDYAITIHADFSVSPDALPTLIRAMDSGADLVIGEVLEGEASLARRLVRRTAPWLLRPGVRVPGVRDLLSGVHAVRLATLKYCLRDTPSSLLESRGAACASAELIARTAAVARQISAVNIPPSRGVASASRAQSALALALELFRTGRQLRIPAPEVEVRRAS
ncbi:MAG: glycosyltransferase family 2 protein [Gemmatimonadetes bacterium]|nr:glycosyltransferase family 2 protein [Gemmatimonadota bacterium]